MSSCPRCGSPDIFGKKFNFGDVTLHEYACNACSLFEEKRSTDADFSAWAHSWSRVVPGSRDVVAIMAAATPFVEPTSGFARGSGPEADVAEQVDEDEYEIATATAEEYEDLVDSICRDVANDALRLRYAELIERRLPERAEFIRLQVNRACAERENGALHSAPSEREAHLRKRLGKQWANHIAPYGRPHTTDGAYRGWEFERGFVAELRTDPDMVADPREYLFKSAPIEHLSLTADGPVRDVFTSPNLARLRSLDLSNLGLGDADARVLSAQSTLARLEWLDLRGNEIGAEGVAALLANPHIRAIPMVLLEGNLCDPAFQYSFDHDGSVMDQWLPPEGANAEKTYGRIGWLHLPYRGRPDRYHARAVRYAK